MARTLEKRSLLAGIVGLAAGAAAAGSTYVIRRGMRRGVFGKFGDKLETDVVDALCEDEVTGTCPIDVASIGHGIIELSGTVPDEEAAERAAAVTQRVAGVHTVVNRLSVEMLEQHLEATRRRRSQGAPELTATAWEGMGSGMGARRQGPTDPAQRDDSAEMKEDAIGMDGRMR